MTEMTGTPEPSSGGSSKLSGIILKTALSFSVSGFCLYFVFHNVPWSSLKEILSRAKVTPILLGILATLVTSWLRALRWSLLLKPFQDFPLFTLFRWQMGGLLINNLLPLRMGEFTRAYWAGHKSDIPKTSVFATIVIERLADIGSLFLLAIVLLSSMGLYRFDYSSPTGIVIAIIITTMFLMAWFVWNRVGMGAISEKLEKFLPHKLALMIEKFVHGLRILKDMREVAKIFFISVLIWSVDIANLTIVSRSLDLNLTWMQAGVTMVGLVLGVMLPAAPGALGTYEALGTSALTLMRFDKALSLSFMILVHASQLLFSFATGIPVLIAEGFSPKKFLLEKPENGNGAS